MEIGVIGLDCWFVHCTSLEQGSSFNRDAIELLKRVDVIFLKRSPLPSELELDPVADLEPDGRLIGSIPLTHSLLKPLNPSSNMEREFLGKYAVRGLDNSFCISSFASMRDDAPDFEAALQDRAEGRLRFFKMLIPHVKPKMGFVDDVWGSVIKDKQAEAAELKKLFWVTYFGPHYVERHGREFFLNAPAWKVEELDGGVLLRTAETFLEFTKAEPKELIKYLRQKFKGITPNRFNIHPAF